MNFSCGFNETWQGLFILAMSLTLIFRLDEHWTNVEFTLQFATIYAFFSLFGVCMLPDSGRNPAVPSELNRFIVFEGKLLKCLDSEKDRTRIWSELKRI